MGVKRRGETAVRGRAARAASDRRDGGGCVDQFRGRAPPAGGTPYKLHADILDKVGRGRRCATVVFARVRAVCVRRHRTVVITTIIIHADARTYIIIRKRVARITRTQTYGGVQHLRVVRLATGTSVGRPRERSRGRTFFKGLILRLKKKKNGKMFSAGRLH